MQVRKMAWRNLWRNRRRTLVTVGAMTLALFAMILYQGLMQGMLQDMERSILEVEIGDLQIHAPGYLDSPSIYSLIEDPDPLLEKIREAGYRAAPRLVGGALVATAESSAGASLRGLDLAADPTVSEISKKVGKGEWLAVDDPSGVVLGYRLSRTLGVEIGDELVALSQATDGSIANDLFFVRGILESVGDATDRAAVLLTASTFREFFVLPEGAHRVIVRRPVSVDLAAADVELSELVGELDLRTWRELLPTLATILDAATAATQVVSVIVYIAIGILILNAMLMAVFERVREFGVLKALGVEPRQVLSLIIAESAYQTLLAIGVGLSLAAPVMWYLVKFGVNTGPLAGTGIMGMTFMAIWHAAVSPVTIGGPTVILVVIVFFAVLYPASKAARISPVEAMSRISSRSALSIKNFMFGPKGLLEFQGDEAGSLGSTVTPSLKCSPCLMAMPVPMPNFLDFPSVGPGCAYYCPWPCRGRWIIGHLPVPTCARVPTFACRSARASALAWSGMRGTMMPPRRPMNQSSRMCSKFSMHRPCPIPCGALSTGSPPTPCLRQAPS